MFCPQCKAEYRQGFTRCADCDVDLVYTLPATESAFAETSQAASLVESDEDPFCSFWKGDDPRIHAELCSVLDDAGIPHKTVRRQDHLFNLSNYPAFQIGVPFSMYETAEEAVKEAFDLEHSDPRAAETLSAPSLLPETRRSFRKLPSTLTLPSEENIPGPPTEGHLLDAPPEEATADIWSGAAKRWPSVGGPGMFSSLGSVSVDGSLRKLRRVSGRRDGALRVSAARGSECSRSKASLTASSAVSYMENGTPI